MCKILRMKSFVCPKCNGQDYFLSKRTVVKGRGMSVRGGVQQFPVCRNCDEIMTKLGSGIMSQRTKLLIVSCLFFGSILALTPWSFIKIAGVIIVFFGGIVGGMISLIVDRIQANHK
jgi:hypothetical protein